MLPDLGRLIHLQQLETTADNARRKISDHPQRIQALEERLQTAREVLAGTKAGLTEAQNTRRTEEKEVATVQARLAKYKDQLLELKTNREYQAMLHEIETAQTDIRSREDRILETMMEADELGAKVKKAEADLKAVEKEVGAERQALEKEVTALQGELNRTAAAREQLASQIDPGVLAIFEVTARSRKGVAVAEARNGLCNICHVRLRPQMFNEVRKNESIIQCDSCRRILYFAGDTARVVAAESAQPNAPAEE
jgi:predicted  nucleic acid-binding Zn-ribbon protein